MTLLAGNYNVRTSAEWSGKNARSTIPQTLEIRKAPSRDGYLLRWDFSTFLFFKEKPNAYCSREVLLGNYFLVGMRMGESKGQTLACPIQNWPL